MKKEAFEKWMNSKARKIEKRFADIIRDGGAIPDVFLRLHEGKYHLILHLDREEGRYSYVLYIDRVTFDVKGESAMLQSGLADDADVDIRGEDTVLWTFETLVEHAIRIEIERMKQEEFYDNTIDPFG